jgi:Exonuclease I
VISLIAPSDPATPDDVDFMLYGGPFLSDHDKALLAECPRLDADKLKSYAPAFEDARYPELVFRYRARNFPSSLSPGEWRQWQQRRRAKLIEGDRGVTSARIHDELNEISAREDLLPHQVELLSEYVQWLDAQPPL